MLATLTAHPYWKSLKQYLPEYFSENLFLQGFGLTKVPTLFFLQPRIIEISDKNCVIKIPLTWRSKNHLNSMYFGALAAGADCAGGFMAMNTIMRQKLPMNMVFKDFKAEFLRRAEGDVYFVCEDGLAVQKLVDDAMETGERQNMTVTVTAYVPTDRPQDPVATFELTLSVKKRQKAAHG